MQRLAETCEAIAGTTKKLEKIAIVADYFISRTAEEAAISAVFLSGRPFPMYQETTLQVGGSLLWQVVQELSEKSEEQLADSYRKHGDLGAVAGEVLPHHQSSAALSVSEAEKTFGEIAPARGPAKKAALLRGLLARVTPLEAKYLVKIMTGDLRIGLKESLVEEAIAKAYGATVTEVQRANMLLGNIRETVLLAAAGKLVEAKMRLFHPIGFMLASPAESAEEALSYFASAAVEDKYDGIRAQAHCSGDEVRIFSRTRDDITESFPELPDVISGLDKDAILDGEILAWMYSEGNPNEPGRALPFSALQQRLGRKKVSQEMMRQVPVAYLVFDVLYAGGELLLERPLSERTTILNHLFAASRKSARSRTRAPQTQFAFDEAEEQTPAPIIRSPLFQASSSQELDELFAAAQARG